MFYSPVKHLRWLLVLVGLLLCVSAYPEELASVPDEEKLNTHIIVKDAYVNIPLPGKTTVAAYFTLHNKSAQNLALVDVRTALTERAELHSHSHKDGVMRMRREDRVMIPAKGSVAFASGSWHVMLFDVTKTLQTGEQLHLILIFGDGTSLPVVAQVRSLFDQPHH